MARRAFLCCPRLCSRLREELFRESRKEVLDLHGYFEGGVTSGSPPCWRLATAALPIGY